MTELPVTAIPTWAFPILFVTGLVAGFVDSIAGGGGLITLPVFFSFGIPPQFALGTNKLQAAFGSGGAAWHYSKSGIVKLSDCGLGIGFTLVGAVAGTLTVQRLDPTFLKHFIPIVLLAIAGYMIFRPKLGEQDIHPRMKPLMFYATAGFALGFYDGFIGPGVGSFWTMAFMLGLGFNLTRATGYTKVMNLASNVASLVFFMLAGQVFYGAGLAMGAGQLLGARIGSRMVVKRGVKFVRPIFLTMVLALTLKLLYDAYRR
ncbi:MAG TPA: TSUP family transporter [Opitutaceae bacterium]|jgi:uncharacterized membrane protein YfcA|nr:TSUP family transporter [Opitutaceae bacterium]